MRKKLFNTLLTLCFLPVVVCAMTVEQQNSIDGFNIYKIVNDNNGYIKYEDAKRTVQEIMKVYYLRGPNLQYNAQRSTYGIESPEESTGQDIKYITCTPFTYDVLVEAFGMNYSDGTPRYTQDVENAAKTYYDALTNDNVDENNYLIYYENKNKNIYYVNNYSESNNISFDNLIKKIQPGDLFYYSGHAMMAYEIVDRDDDGIKDDVLMLNSTTYPRIRTRITNGISNIFYHFTGSELKSNILDIDSEGSIQSFWLSTNNRFITNNQLTCTEDLCTIIRPYFSDENGDAVFNYLVDTSKYKNSFLRTNYPGLYIEKTVDKGDNNSVYLGDKLTYTIKITNKSDADYQNVNYGAFTIEEKISNYVDYEYNSANLGGTFDGGAIKWYIDGLNLQESIELKYTVNVTESTANINKNIEAIGYFYANDSSKDSYITTGTVNNNIILKQFDIKYDGENGIKNCYESKKDFTGLSLIDEIYKCSNINTIEFNDSFNFEDIIIKNTSATSTTSNAIRIVPQNEISFKFTSMILNNYWGGLIKNEKDDYVFPLWNRISVIPKINVIGGPDYRAKTIVPTDFKDGDVLIYGITNSKYTKEDGLYAYIYMNGKFIGNNYSGQSNERNEFTYHYYENNGLSLGSNLYQGYSSLQNRNDKEQKLEFINYQTLFDKDYYVILRPSSLPNTNDIHKINYYLGVDETTSETVKIGEGYCVNNGYCALIDFKYFSTAFPYENKNWTFGGWDFDVNGIDIQHTDGEIFNYDYVNDINLYAIGKRTFCFSSGISPVDCSSTIYQKWNPTSIDNVTGIIVPEAINIDNENKYGWNFIG